MSKIESKPIENKLNKDAILAIVKEVSLNCYGVIDFSKITNTKGQQVEDIKVIISNKQVSINEKIIVANDLKITEIARSCQKAVRTAVNIKFPNSVKEVNVFVEDLYKA